MFVCLLLVLGSYSHAYSFKLNLTNATISTSWNAHAPDVYALAIVADRDYAWPTISNTYTPVWRTANTWTGLTDADLSDVLIGFIDDRLGEVIDYGEWNLSSSTYKSPADNPVVHRLHFTGLDLVDFYGEVTITDSGGTNTSCSTYNTSTTCNNDPSCWWYNNVCYNESLLCDGYTCDTCTTADSCANDPDVNAAGGCVWNSTSSKCEERRSGNECSSYTASTCDKQSSCAWYKDTCYPSSWLCSKVTCDSCSTSLSCANDPDMIAAGGCSWNSSSNACYNSTTSSCVKVCAEANAGCKPSCVVNIEGCPCLCDTSGCVPENLGFGGEGNKWDHSTTFETIAALPHSSKNELVKRINERKK